MSVYICSHSFHLQGVQTTGLQFRLVDAKEQVVGRLAAQLSVILQATDCKLETDYITELDVVLVAHL